MSRSKKKSLNQLVLQNIIELEKDKNLLKLIEIKIENKHIKKPLKYTEN